MQETHTFQWEHTFKTSSNMIKPKIAFIIIIIIYISIKKAEPHKYSIGKTENIT